MTNYTAEEIQKMKTGTATEKEIQNNKLEEERLQLAKNIKTKDFILHRTQETIKVPIVSSEGVLEIEIRARLTIPENKEHEAFLTKFKRASAEEAFEFEEGDPDIYKFMAAITTDQDLDAALWAQVDTMTISEILIAYFMEPAKRMADAHKFRQRK